MSSTKVANYYNTVENFSRYIMIQYLSKQNPEIFHNKKVLVRLDLNVPVTDGVVTASDASRIIASLPTLQYLQNAGAIITIISHIGRKPGESLDPVITYLSTLINLDNITILPNLRSNPGEELNDPVFAVSLCEGQDYYVNDAFAVSHRAHASVVGVPTIMEHEKCFTGFQLEKEIEFLNQALSPRPPSLLIMGGAKFETKLPVIETLLPLVDHVLVGGALLNNFLKSSGVDIGDSLIDPAADINHLIHNPKIIIPDNLIWQDNKILDIDPEYFNNPEIRQIITKAQTIIWNGPMGYYEGGFTGGTETFTRLLAESSGTKIIGGGDSVALIQQLHLTDKFDFLSTGGGAMLEFFEGKVLPGIAAINK